MTTDPATTLIRAQIGQRRVWAALLTLAVVLPWLNPFSSGPSPNTVPLLISGFCALTLAAGYSVLGLHLERRATQVTLFSAWLLAALVASAMGLAQYFGMVDALAPWVNYASVGEAFANLRQRNQFASLTSIGLACVLCLAARGGSMGGRGRDVLRLVGVALALGLLAVGNAASASRTGASQWLMVVVLTGLWSRPNQRRVWALAVSALLLYAAAVLTLPALLQGVTGQTHTGLMGRLYEPSGCGSRRILWANVLELIAEKPWWGWGWGELKFAHFSHTYTGTRFCDILDNAHNLPLHWAVELGLPLAALLCAAVAYVAWRSQPWRETDVARQMAWTILAIIGLHSLLEYPLWYGPFQMAVGLCVWLLWRPTDLPSFAPSASRANGVGTTLVPACMSGVMVGALVFLIYATWDYTRISQLYLPIEQRLAGFRVDTLHKARASWLFSREVQFAELTTAAHTADAAPKHYAMAQNLLHFSPEASVLQVLLESAQQLGLDDESTRHTVQQFQAAYPHQFAEWHSKQQTAQATRTP